MVHVVKRRQNNYSRQNIQIPKVIRQHISPLFFCRLSSWLLTGFVVLVVFVVLRYIVQSTIFASDYTISSVRYDSGSVGTFDEPLLYSTITKYLHGKNYYMVQYFGKGKLLAQIQDTFPMVASLELFFLEKNIAAMSLQFTDPLLLVVAGDKKFAVYNDNYIVPLYPHNMLGSQNVQLVLADYASGLQSLDGLFFKISPEQIIEQLTLFDVYFRKPYQVLYFPGAEKTQITAADGKILYFNNLGDIQGQLQKIDLLKTYYSGFDALWQFDLGSLDMYTVIVKK